MSKKCKCAKCKEEKELSDIMKLECNHCFCWGCLREYSEQTLKSNMKCPLASCNKLLNDMETRQVLSDDDEVKYDRQCLDKIRSMHKCLLPHCEGIVSCTSPDAQYECSLCTLFNCVSCSACHATYTCKGFQLLSPEMKTKLCKEESARADKIYQEKRKENMREETFSISQIDSFPNDRIVQCQVCDSYIAKGAGVKLKNCCHEVCKPCFVQFVLNSPKLPPSCPCCDECVDDGEIQSILSHEELLEYRDLCESVAEKHLDHHFRCQAADCGTLHLTTTTTTTFKCTKCGALNCVQCKAVHTGGMTCQQYQIMKSTDKSEQKIQEQIKEGKIWPCIVCGTYLMKISGCNLIQCPGCKTELCWINRMLRWGPGGRGDTSGGCKCWANGKPCHKDCTETCAPHGNPQEGDIFLLILRLIQESLQELRTSENTESAQNSETPLHNLERMNESAGNAEESRTSENTESVQNSETPLHNLERMNESSGSAQESRTSQITGNAQNSQRGRRCVIS